MTLAPMSEVLEALRAGKPVLVSDAADRENEGDAIISAALASTEWVAWMVRWTSGYLCAPMSSERADELALPPMVVNSEDTRHTAYTITVDAAEGVTTGISAHDRALTLRVLGDPTSTAASLIRPGHIVPLRAVPGGVRDRAGHTEAAVDLLKAAGLEPVGAIGEMIAEDGSAMKMDELFATGERFGLPVTTIELLIEYLNEQDGLAPDVAAEAAAETLLTADPSTVDAAVAAADGAPVPTRHAGPGSLPGSGAGRVHFEVETLVPTVHGPLRMRAYRDLETGADHLAIVSGDPAALASTTPLVRVHSECLTGEAFGSLKCECGPQLDAALDLVAEDGGVVVYLRGHEGRGIGLVNKLRAYRLQEDGLDTLDANVALGLPADARDYGAAVAILDDLGARRIRLLTNNPEKVSQLEARGIEVAERVGLVVGATEQNRRYLDTKRDRMGHVLPAAH
ncbi:GTP cyclohydrolase II [Herbiconiux sp. CPCC 203407]|uniref:GTP cyclohydrolase-2 n=1 Tax=Herbiconiux oxytropis TaxID=2970915 RepID=A0AA42BUM7_9MICO|nr:GTP cyclohydrolase II [Herbiconiux oxytropis]MCS5721941.1 GTP cyclohydrolase II [Herbiconiux oxytropis]MCS5725524.1 GTP cyclohydrolase II [Herbiconiux oxytropis]